MTSSDEKENVSGGLPWKVLRPALISVGYAVLWLALDAFSWRFTVASGITV